MDYSNDNLYDFSDQNESNVPNGSNFENGTDSGCGSSVDDYANSPYPNSPFASSAVYTSSSLAVYASASYAAYASSTHEDRFGCIEEESDDELIIVDDTNDVINNSLEAHQPEVQPEVQPELQPEPMDVGADELGRGLENIQIDISGHQASRVIVSNMGAARHFCDLCGTAVENLDDHFGNCPAELDLGPDIDQVFDARDYLDHLMANEPRAEPPPIATRFIPGDHINNMEYILNCMSKERLRNN